MFLYYTTWFNEMLDKKKRNDLPFDKEKGAREALARHMFGFAIEKNMRRLSTESQEFMRCAKYNGDVVISTHAGGYDHAPARYMLVGEVKEKATNKKGKQYYKKTSGGHLVPSKMWNQIISHIFSNDIKPANIFFLACNSGNEEKCAWVPNKKGKTTEQDWETEDKDEPEGCEDEACTHNDRWDERARRDGWKCPRTVYNNEGFGNNDARSFFDPGNHQSKMKPNRKKAYDAMVANGEIQLVQSYAEKIALKIAENGHGRTENFAGAETTEEGVFTGYKNKYNDEFVTALIAPRGFFVRGTGNAILKVENNYNANHADPGQKFEVPRMRGLWNAQEHDVPWSTANNPGLGYTLFENIKTGRYGDDPNFGFGRWDVPLDADRRAEDADMTPAEIDQLTEGAADLALAQGVGEDD